MITLLNALSVGTSDGLHLGVAIALHSRDRFINNLLPLLQRATGLRPVVTVAGGGKEGRLDETDFEGWNRSTFSVRGHIASVITLSLEALAKKAREISFIHDFPDAVRSGLGRDVHSITIFLLKLVFKSLGRSCTSPRRNRPNDTSFSPRVHGIPLLRAETLGCLCRMESAWHEERMARKGAVCTLSIGMEKVMGQGRKSSGRVPEGWN